MEKTPLELYETAYRLHYTENRVAEAKKYYEALVKEFPDSDECGYAVIQLQKIKSSDIAGELKKSLKSGPMPVIALVISLFALALTVAMGFYIYKQYKIESVRTRLTVNALGKMFNGEEEEALKTLTELKILAKNDLAPFELSADIYRKLKKYDQARAEYEIFYKLNPDQRPSEGVLQRMKQDETNALRERRRPERIENVIQSDVPVADTVKPKKTEAPVSRPKAAAVKKQPAAQQQKQIKGLFLVDPDSISYF